MTQDSRIVALVLGLAAAPAWSQVTTPCISDGTSNTLAEVDFAAGTASVRNVLAFGQYYSGSFDVDPGAGPPVTLLTAEPDTGSGPVVNELVQTSLTDYELELGCVASGPVINWASLPLVPDSDPAQFQLRDAGPVRELWRDSPWDMAWGPAGTPSHHDVLTLDQSGDANLGGLFPGHWTQNQGHVHIILDGGSHFNGNIEGGGFNGTGSHFSQSVVFDAVPQTPATVLSLHHGRFQVTTDWSQLPANPTQTPATAVHNTEETGSFYFSNPDNADLVLRVLDGCSFNDHYWVFFAATTNVEFTITVTDTQTDTTVAYNNPGGAAAAPAIQDTEAFATCP